MITLVYDTSSVNFNDIFKNIHVNNYVGNYVYNKSVYYSKLYKFLTQNDIYSFSGTASNLHISNNTTEQIGVEHGYILFHNRQTYSVELVYVNMNYFV